MVLSHNALYLPLWNEPNGQTMTGIDISSIVCSRISDALLRPNQQNQLVLFAWALESTDIVSVWLYDCVRVFDQTDNDKQTGIVLLNWISVFGRFGKGKNLIRTKREADKQDLCAFGCTFRTRHLSVRCSARSQGPENNQQQDTTNDKNSPAIQSPFNIGKYISRAKCQPGVVHLWESVFGEFKVKNAAENLFRKHLTNEIGSLS